MSLGSLWLLLAIGVAALTGANPVLVKQTSSHGSARDRHVRVYRTGQLRQDGSEEVIIPRQFDPEHDDWSDLVASADETVQPQQHAQSDSQSDSASSSQLAIVASELRTLAPARTVIALVVPDDARLPAPGQTFPHRGRAPPRA